jgi:hypothetical protein
MRVDIGHAQAQHRVGPLRSDLYVRLAGFDAAAGGDDVAVAAQCVQARLRQGQRRARRRRHARTGSICGISGRKRIGGAFGGKDCRGPGQNPQ